MIEELNKYKIVDKTKAELERDKIFNSVMKKLWDDAGYMSIYNLGALDQLQSIARVIKKYGIIDLDAILKLISTFKDSEGVSDLVDIILEEFDYEEN